VSKGRGGGGIPPRHVALCRKEVTRRGGSLPVRVEMRRPVELLIKNEKKWRRRTCCARVVPLVSPCLTMPDPPVPHLVFSMDGGVEWWLVEVVGRW